MIEDALGRMTSESFDNVMSQLSILKHELRMVRPMTKCLIHEGKVSIIDVDEKLVPMDLNSGSTQRSMPYFSLYFVVHDLKLSDELYNLTIYFFYYHL